MNSVRKFRPAEPVDGTVTPLAGHPEYADALGELRRAGYKVSSVTLPDLMPHGLRQVQIDGLAQFKRALAEIGAL